MSLICLVCKEVHSIDEVNLYNINGELVSSMEMDLERNCQNPDYAPHVICTTCDTERMDQNLWIVTDMGTLSIDVKLLSNFREVNYE